jgi:hypothetical protein
MSRHITKIILFGVLGIFYNRLPLGWQLFLGFCLIAQTIIDTKSAKAAV